MSLSLHRYIRSSSRCVLVAGFSSFRAFQFIHEDVPALHNTECLLYLESMRKSLPEKSNRAKVEMKCSQASCFLVICLG